MGFPNLYHFIHSTHLSFSSGVHVAGRRVIPVNEKARRRVQSLSKAEQVLRIRLLKGVEIWIAMRDNGRNGYGQVYNLKWSKIRTTAN